MNRAYRHIWSAARGAYIIAPETARGHGKAGRAVRAPALLALAAGLALTDYAAAAGPVPATTVVPVNGKATAYISGNGVPVVNINTANAAGVSHNQFSQYNVEAKGLVLNNSSFRNAAVVQSQLAGQLVGNLNLAAEAKLIVNEVVSTNRSVLAGYTEVVGSRADVIVANPYGITCSGCGFINSDRVTLTTGIPGWGADGSFNGVSVSRGDILIDGAGLNASAQQILDLVTRAVRIDGQINTVAAGTLGIFAGPNQWSYASRDVTGTAAGADAQPAYAIDSTALGGMYAGRIRLIATEAGVGVRMLGDAAASVDDFRLDAGGKVLIQSRVAAARDIQLAQSGAATLEVSGADSSLTAQNALSLQAEGALTLSEGLLKAGTDLTVKGASLTDSAGAGATRSAGGNVDLAILGAASIDGSSWGAGAHLKLDAASIAAGAAGVTLYSGASAASADRALVLSAGAGLALAKARITSTDGIHASAGTMRLGAEVEMTAAADLALTANSAWDNAGLLIAGRSLTLQGSDAATVLQAGNSGLMQAQATLAIGAGQAAALSNGSGARLLAERIALDATTLDNSGTIQATSALDLNASGKFDNQAAGTVLTAAAGAAIKLKAAGLDNAGRLQSAGAFAAAVGGASVNSGKLLTTSVSDGGSDGALTLATASLANSGMIVAAGAGAITSTAALENSNRIQASALTLAAGALRNQGADSVLLARGAVTLNSASFDNAGAVQAGTSLSITAADTLNNRGALQNLDAASALSLRALDIANSGTVQAAGTATLASGGALDNSGKLLAGADLNLTAVATLSNSGAASLMLAQHAMTVRAADVQNEGGVQAGGALTLSATQGIANRGTASQMLTGASLSSSSATFDNAGTVQANDGLGIDATGQLNNQAVVANLGAGTTLSLGGGNIVNNGTVQSAGSASVSASSGDLFNNGDIKAGDSLYLSAAGALDIGTNAVLLAQAALTSRSTSVDNSGTVQAGSGLSMYASGSLVNRLVIQDRGAASSLSLNAASIINAGTVQALGTASLVGTAGAIDNQGQVLAGGNLDLSAATALNNTGAASVLLSDAALSAHSASFANSGTVEAGNGLAVNATGALNNSSVIETTGTGTLTLQAATIGNTGALQASAAASLASITGAFDNSGQILADGDLAIQAATALNNTGAASKIVGQQALHITGGSGFSVSNAGRVQAAGDLTVGSAATAVALLTNSGGATLLGATVRVDSADLLNQGRMQAMGAGTLATGTLTNQGSGAVILLGLDGSASTIQAATTLSNEGAIHGGGDLAIGAARIDNSNTAGISSLADLTLTASANGIGNAGALYAGGTLSLAAAGQSIVNTSSGTLDATDIVLAAATFDNYNTVIATGDTSITTTSAFNNLPTGGVPNIVVASTVYDGVTTPYDSGDYNCNFFGDYCDHLWVHAQNYTVTEGLDGAVPVQKGQIIAGGTINLNYGGSGVNRASLISAPTINISGSGSFTNVDLHLDRIEYARRWRVYKTDSTFGSLNYDYRYPTDTGQFGCNDGGCFGGSAGSEAGAASASAALETGRTTIQIWSAGVYATQLVFNGGSLRNLGSPYTRSTSATSVAGAAAAGVAPATGAGASPAAGLGLGALSGTKVAPSANALASTSRAVSVAAANGISFAGLNLALPTNPNGYFVTAKNSTSGYLVETNPLFGAGSNSVGSNYLSSLLGIDPDKQQKRLGDANYEAKLIRDQLVAQTGNNIIKGQKNEAAQVKALMENAASMAGTMGLTLGQPLTAEQAAGLTEDMVWMVEQVVGGQQVLVPVVYLAQSTKDAIESGAVMAATNASIKAGTLENTGGTIAADQLAITTEGDLRNTGGKIKGGDVAIKAGGSIVNETVATTSGGKDFARTVIGAAGSIESTGTLSLDAAKDISVKGAAIKAGGDASLAAGGSVTFDTIQDKRADATYKASQGLWGLSSSSSSTHTASSTNLGASLETGGKLAIKSGADTTIAGSSVKAGGKLELDAGGNVNVIARQDTVETSVSSSHSGLGVGGGVYGSSTTTTDAFKGRNVGSTLEAGGDASVNTAGTLTLQGSRLKVGGDAAITAADVQVLAGQDVDRSSTTTTTTSFLKLSSSGGSHAGAGAQADASAGSGKGKGSASASAGAGAEAGATGSVGLTLAETETTTTTSYKSRAVGSEIEVGNRLGIDARNAIVLQGAKVDAGGDVELKAKDVKVLASQDIDVTTSKTTTTQIGLYADSDNSAKAGASASAEAKGGANGHGAGGAASAQAQAGASADSDTTIDLVRVTTTESNSLDIRNNGSTINAGGKLKVDAADKLTVQGSDLGGDKGVALKAKDMEFLAADDVSVTSTSTSRTSAGLYISGGASAQANASAGANGQQNVLGGAMGNASADGSASAEAKVGAGWQARTTSEKSLEGTTTARVSTIRSGSGDIERNAQNGIVDVGTAIEAAGDFSQSASTIDSRAAKNTSFSSSSTESNSLRVGAYVQGNAEAGAGEAGANASAGAEAQFSHEQSAARSDSSEAVVSTIKAGGKVSSASSGKTTLEGTQISAEGSVELAAGEIDFKAAKNTESSSDSSLSVDAAANIGINLGSSGAVEGGVSGGFGAGQASSSSSTAVAGSIQSGGKLTVKTQGDARFEGTDIAAGGDAAVSAGGKLTFDAARNESSSSSDSSNAEMSISVSKSKSAGGSEHEAGLEAAGGFSKERESSSEAVTGRIAAGGNLTLSAGKDMRFEGTAVEGGADTTIAAGGNVDFAAARNTGSSESTSFSASLSMSKSSSSDSGTGESSNGKSGGIGAEFGYARERSSEAVAGSVASGGNLQIKSGGNTTLEGTDVSAAGAASIHAGGNVNFKAAESSSESVSVAASVGAEGSSSHSTGPSKAEGAAPGATETVDEKEHGGSASLEAGYAVSSAKQGGAIRAGSIDIGAGGSVAFEGTRLGADGAVAVAAQGGVSVAEARSTSSSVGIAMGGQGQHKTVPVEEPAEAPAAAPAAEEAAVKAAPVVAKPKVPVRKVAAPAPAPKD